MNKEEILEDVKRHLDYVNATNQKSIRDTEMEVMYQEIDRLNNIINEAKEFLISYESINEIQQLEEPENNKRLDKDTIIEMVRRYLKVHDKLLNILELKEEGNKNENNRFIK